MAAHAYGWSGSLWSGKGALIAMSDRMATSLLGLG